MALLKPLNGSLATQDNSMIVAAKRFCSNTSSASGINVNLKNNARLHVRVQHVAPPVPAEAKLGYTLRVIDWLLMVAYEWQSPDWSVAAKVYEPGSNGSFYV